MMYLVTGVYHLEFNPSVNSRVKIRDDLLVEGTEAFEGTTHGV